MKMLVSILFLSGILLHEDAIAGRLYARRPNTESPLYNLKVEKIKTSVSIHNLLAITHVDEEFYNGQSIDLEGFYVFQLPEGAQIDGLWLWIDGLRQTFAVKRKEEATQIYDSLVTRGIGDPAILQTLGSNRFQLKVFPIKAGSTRRIELEYFQLLPINKNGVARYYYPLNLSDYQSTPVSFTGMTIRIEANFPIDSISSNFDDWPLAYQVHQSVDTLATITFGQENSTYVEDLSIQFSLRDWSSTFPIMTYAEPDTIADGFFLLWTPIRLDPLETVKGDFVFALDASGSMTGQRIPAVRRACDVIFEKLQPYDRFRIVLFSDTSVAFPADTSMLFATRENIDSAMKFLDRAFVPGGKTNYEMALRRGSQSNFRGNAEKRMIFITDGLPITGSRTAQALEPLLRSPDGSIIRFFPVTIYTESIAMLYDLSRRCNGKLTTLEQGQDLASVLATLTFDFGSRTISHLRLNLPGDLYQCYPNPLPDEITPEEACIAGRFAGEGLLPIAVSHEKSGRIDTLTHMIPFTRVDDNPVQIARYWAALRIKQLLTDLQNAQNQTEIKESIIRLSEKFMILSPYTAFIVIKEEIVNRTPVNAEGSIPDNFRLFQNYPNPFSAATGNSSTTIRFQVPAQTSAREAFISVKIFDEQGRLVAILFEGAAQPGIHSIRWDGRDHSGRTLSSGIYYCTLQAGTLVRTIRMTLLK